MKQCKDSIELFKGKRLHKDRAMQGQRGTFGFHEQGKSTRLKIYSYVTAI